MSIGSIADRWVCAFGLFILVWVVSRFVALRLDLEGLGNTTAAAIAVAFSLLLLSKRAHIAFSWRPLAPLAAIVAGAGLLIFGVFYSGYTLPSHDPIAIPVLARSIVEGRLPLTAYEQGSSAFSYPPGLPILLAMVAGWLDPIDRLLVFKVIVLSAVTMVPANWAWMHLRLFPLRISSPIFLTISYFVFFGIERTLGFAVPFAGKSAILFGLWLAPIVAVLCVWLSMHPLGWILGAVALFGLTLVHYSLLHLMAALLGAYALVGLIGHTIRWQQVLSIILMGALAALLTLLLLSEALIDPRAGDFSFKFNGLISVIETIVARHSFMVIYTDAGFGILGFIYRGPALCLAILFSLTVARLLGDKSIRDATCTYGVAVVIALLFGFSVVPVGITLDFMRWFLWAPQAAILLTASCSVWCLMSHLDGRPRLAIQSAAAICVVAAAGTVAVDAAVFSRVNREQALARNELSAIRDVLRLPAGVNCLLIGDSSQMASGQVTAQKSKLLDYAEAVTSCRYLNGSWVHPGTPGGRALNGFPSPEVLGTALAGSTVFFFGNRKSEYEDDLRHAGMETRWALVGYLGGEIVWRVGT